jgi:hypothetical protein
MSEQLPNAGVDSMGRFTVENARPPYAPDWWEYCPLITFTLESAKKARAYPVGSVVEINIKPRK